MEFDSEKQLLQYRQQHKVRPDTKLEVKSPVTTTLTNKLNSKSDIDISGDSKYHFFEKMGMSFDHLPLANLDKKTPGWLVRQGKDIDGSDSWKLHWWDPEKESEDDAETFLQPNRKKPKSIPETAFRELVKKKDLKAARKMLNEVARDHGFESVPMWHGSSQSNLSSFDCKGGLFLTTSKKAANEYASDGKESLYHVYVKTGKNADLDDISVFNKIGKKAELSPSEIRNARKTYEGDQQDWWRDYQDKFTQAAKSIGFDSIFTTDILEGADSDSVTVILLNPNFVKTASLLAPMDRFDTKTDKINPGGK